MSGDAVSHEENNATLAIWQTRQKCGTHLGLGGDTRCREKGPRRLRELLLNRRTGLVGVMDGSSPLFGD